MSASFDNLVAALIEHDCRVGCQRPNGRMAQCPAHDDRTPSLSVKEGEDGRVLLKCFAGCSADEVVAALDLTMADLFDDDRSNGGWRAEREAMNGGRASGQDETPAFRIRRALLTDAQDTFASSGPPRQEIPGTGGMLHRGVAAVVFGSRGTGKSIAALTIALGAVAEGERVLYLDSENGPNLTRTRIEDALSVRGDWEAALDGFVGRHHPRIDADWNAEDYAEALRGFAVVIYDPLREFLFALDLNPDDEQDVARFHNLAVAPLTRAGAAVLILDNTGHEAAGRMKGSKSKEDTWPQLYKVTTTEPFTPVSTGRIKLACTRSRYGDEGREWTMRIGGGAWEAPASTSEAPDAERARQEAEHREQFLLVCIKVLDEDAPLGRDPLIQAARKKGIKGKSDQLREWLVAFASDPASRIVQTGQGYDLNPDPGERGQGGVNPTRNPDPAPPSMGARVNPDPSHGGQGDDDRPVRTTEDRMREMGIDPIPERPGG